ncbi:MAG: helix-turn-helix domain-containing protein [Campylobacteraceae bacterium]|jgi:plasmid maintenance system antidote protein VapI|nr:helix-turn-helix domain-containing protein [Campylobacteraceae bacterium]
MNITQNEIAKVLHVTQSTISKMCKGKLRLKAFQAFALKEKLNWSDDDIKFFFNLNTTKSKTCAQELPSVTKCDDGNGGVQEGANE